MDQQQPAVLVEEVSKTFAGRSVLDHLSFQVGHGEAFCLLGRSGMGKSVTLKLLIGLLKPDEGRILIDGQDVNQVDSKGLREIRKRVGFLFQDGALFDSISVQANVAFPLRRHTKKPEREIREIVQERLEDVELGKEGRKMPSELSGGMRKRVGLARALALNPKILLVDEPSSGLDRITAFEIYQLLRKLKDRQHVAQVVVTHDVIGSRELSNNFGVLNKGRIVANGTLEELQQNENETVRELVSIGEAERVK